MTGPIRQVLDDHPAGEPRDIEPTIIRMLGEGATYSLIGAALGMTRSGVSGKVMRMKKRGLLVGVERNRPNVYMPRREGVPVKAKKKERKAKPAVAPAPTPIPVVEAPAPAPSKPPGMIALLDLQRHHCRWPMGERPFLFCGEPKERGSYCAKHADLGTVKARATAEEIRVAKELYASRAVKMGVMKW